MLRHLATFFFMVILSGTTIARSAAADPERSEFSFRNDVMAVLSKAGCNAGVCHGNANGKGGFKLSLRGENPEADFAALTRGQSARRINRLDPDQSLILLKPTMQVAHEGGRRFAADSDEYRILRRWIAGGMAADGENVPRIESLVVTPAERVLSDPEDSIALRVEAIDTFGGRRDVTRMAVYEWSNENVSVSSDGRIQREDFGEATVIVRYLDRQAPVRVAFIRRQPGFVFQSPEPANFIDESVFAKLRALEINPSPVADDAVFVRRAFLDLVGFLPSAEEAREFLADPNPGKRAALVDRLLERQEFADFWALKWSDLLRNEEKTLDRKGVQGFHAFIRDGIARDKPLDLFVRELVAARGSTYTNPEANFYRAMRDPLMRGESAAQLFLGVRLQCAKCHSHPFDRWTQDDYYGWANLFARVRYKILRNDRRDRNDGHEFNGEQIVYLADRGDVENPNRGGPTPPRFLGGDGARPGSDRLIELAEWLTSPRNERFARTQANRIWFNLMGRGIVEPIDDFRATNPAVNPQLLDELANELVASKFSLRHMIRVIVNSRTYQLSSIPNETNRDDEINFSHPQLRRLTAEQLLDSIVRVVDVPVEFNGYPEGMRAGEIPGVHAVRPRDQAPSSADRFLTTFGKPERLQPCECERSDEATLDQALHLVNGSLVGGLLSAEQGRIQRMIDADASTGEIVEEFFWQSLSRRPTDEELSAATSHIDTSRDRRNGIEDVVWALVTSREFLLRR